MKKIRVGVIGVGYLGRFHAQKYAKLEGVELIGVADINGEQAAAVAKECNCRAIDDYKTLLAEIDAASIVVPTTSHHQIAVDCIERGIDLLLEKPMTVTIDEADELVKKAQNNNTILQVGLLERFNPAVQAMQTLLTTPAFIESERITMFRNRGADVDVVLDLMIHDIDIILTIVNSPLVDIQAVGTPVVTKTTDIANARLTFANGATANITASRISQTSSRKMKVFQPGSYVSLDFADRKVTMTTLPEEGGDNGIQQPTVEAQAFENSDALMSEVQHFIDSVRQRSQPVVSGREGRMALDVALKIIDKIKAHRDQSVFKDVNFARGM